MLVKALQRLGIFDVVQASDCEQAMTLLLRSGRVDIVFCDLAERCLDCVEFFHYASQLNLAKSVVLSFELLPNLSRTIWQMPSLSGLKVLGVLGKPLELRSLQRLLHQYDLFSSPPLSRLPPPQKLPSEQDVRRGLEAGEFHAWYQPKLDMRSGRLAGVEALARWRHPIRGLLMPKDFLAAVLAYDLIDDMFKHMLQQGLNLLSQLRRRGVTLELAFNLHASQLTDRRLSSHITQALSRYGLHGTTLMFELVENGLLNASLVTQENLLRLRLLGCGLSIDDFGVGFSSLALLGELPFTQIKLGGCTTDLASPHSQALVASTLALARALHMSMVVKGVNSQTSRDTLVTLGCYVGQGFYLAHPMDGKGFVQWLESQHSGM
ncbi:EAL domain-containing response regulator [Pseudomonas chlororaphis]|uniref:EAL domain-containing response regulator n=1 Tax=Pseudomonas chlororaphis TaxID=587753 RepID=UPI000F6D62E0|nr:EAL domain-containing response regulator [Pseudomonas chlororaphis]AZC53299.1 diguanylate cyclase/phosphodiesterase [Pseudomonas chlororaphis subsp. piscium]AZC59596.1 diguanylate cyclase/phosphodiesterase [Pseudomonas chlororaphis subsp. piscium]AZC78257.1 diguanylate cyclase/phosphodiesterase [Pseudomonas chlororaphis subsp. piscium]AZC98058.1 diguanylate cyclase/phosphodiesterase [Pseudomonas chlororaphis subsp. piscium]MBP5057007.1 EAL domain-containing response regulator [Pseudomonas c